MSDSQEKIIVFRAYDTVVEANLAKTKLDAYGIPCFLTEENLTSLYPVRMGIFPGVRLHIFEKDTQEVGTLLGDNEIMENRITCPTCGSYSWEPMHAWRKIYTSLLTLLDISSYKEYHCKNCNNYF